MLLNSKTDYYAYVGSSATQSAFVGPAFNYSASAGGNATNNDADSNTVGKGGGSGNIVNGVTTVYPGFPAGPYTNTFHYAYGNNVNTSSYNAVWLAGGGSGATGTGVSASFNTFLSGSVTHFTVTGSNGVGGPGILSYINGTATYFGGGGGTNTYQESYDVNYPSVSGSWITYASGGIGGGGQGDPQNTGLPATTFQGTDGLGGGGGGGSARRGGTGIIYIRYNRFQQNLV